MSIIPIPVETRAAPGEYSWCLGGTAVAIVHGCDGSRASACLLMHSLALHCHLPAKVMPASPGTTAAILLLLETDMPELQCVPLRHEGYVLTVCPRSGVCVRAESPAGLFYGIQSLLQLLPWSKTPPVKPINIPAVYIRDWPRFEYRGTLLDVGRHMFSVTFIKKFLVVLALHKVNRFHWHLTEDQGWRIEIKSLPRLTDVGAWRGTGDSRYGGYYTHEDIKAVVAFAAARFIQVIPEIELPGHCKAALSCYPSLSCTGISHPVPTQWGVQTDVYCAGKEETFQFLETVLAEVVELFPCKYVHIGGDECPKVRWAACSLCQQRIRDNNLTGEDQLQTWFIQRIASFLKSRGRQIIGWDEILEGGIPEDAVVMSWRGTSGGVLAAQQKHRVIMCPNNRCYFDYRQTANIQEPGTWYAVLPIEWVYMFEPFCRPVPCAEAATLADSKCGPDAPETPCDGSTQTGVSACALTELSNAAQGMSIASTSASDAHNATQACLNSSRMDTCSSRSSTESLDVPSVAATGAAGAPGVIGADMAAQVNSVSGQMADTLTAADEAYIIGGQANLWTEFIADEGTAEYMLLPRLCAFAECVWSMPQARNWRHFTERAQTMLNRLHVDGYNYRPLSPPH